ncbi:MAG TPA: MFS transporter [Casimicrobiaceae bacterium]|nr:MFS transporter [Casimicrobiaceae bacterium]
MTASEARYAHPVVFLLLILPFGAVSGYLTVAVAYGLAQAGVGADRIAALVAVSLLPQTWKFLWAPAVDTTLTRKTWYLLGSAGTAIGIVATGALPATAQGLSALQVVVLLSNLALTFLAMAVESLMVYGTHPGQLGRASGWFQAGNLGGQGLGGGAGLWMAQSLPAPWMSGAILGLLCASCSFALWRLREPPLLARSGKYVRDLRNVLLDLWNVVHSRAGTLALLIVFLPIGTGAAQNLWAAVADDWHASADTVALVTGVLGGIASALGCLIGGFGCDRMNRKSAYVIYGALQAGCAVAMALAPRTESMYILFTMLYAVITGLTYAGFSAVVLEAIGFGAAATKYNVFASLSNMPIAYMTVVLGWAHVQRGAGAMLFAEALCAVAAMAIFVVAATRLSKRRAAKTAPGV